MEQKASSDFFTSFEVFPMSLKISAMPDGRYHMLSEKISLYIQALSVAYLSTSVGQVILNALPTLRMRLK
jgi:hypothetical protein